MRRARQQLSERRPRFEPRADAHRNRDGDTVRNCDADARADFRKFLATTELPATSDKAVFAAAQLAR